RRSDIFALAIVVWELTAGRRLYRHESDLATMKAIAEADAPSPGGVRPGYPAELERIVLKGLARGRAQRYQTAEQMQADLEAFAREQKLPVSPRNVAAFMRELFADKVEAWQHDRAGGVDLAEHVVRTLAGEPAAAPPEEETRTSPGRRRPPEVTVDGRRHGRPL